MAATSNRGDRTKPLSVTIISTIVEACVGVLASLTVLTHVAQIAGATFRTYAYLCVPISLLVLVAIIFLRRASFEASQPRDYLNLGLVLLIAVIGAALAVSIHRIGRISPDEYYYAANPVYYTQHADSAMGFEDRLFYTREPIFSTGFFTAGATEYVEAAFAFVANVRFATLYYIAGAAAIGFLVPLALYLAIYALSGSAAGAAFGAFLTLVSLMLMGETSWAPGANSFARAFEGKALLQFAGVPLLIAYSIEYFRTPGVRSWLILLGLGIAMAGASTTSFALLPLTGIVLCASYWIAFRREAAWNGRFLGRLALYFASFAYLGLWALFVARHDGVETATFLNGNYPSTFGAYLTTFIYPPYPLTPLLTILGCALAAVLAPGRMRAMLAWWIALAVVIVLNPLSAEILLQYFRGIYYRLFYVLPFPISIGLTGAFAWMRLKQRAMRNQRLLGGVAWIGAAVLPFVIPVSLVRLPLYGWGNTLYDGDLARASQLVGSLPPGTMLAPYPLSGAISMLDSDAPQMLTRPDLLDFYLGRQANAQDAALRSQAQLCLDGDVAAAGSMGQLLMNYPEIKSVAMEKSIYERDEPELDAILSQNGFRRIKVSAQDIVAFVR